MGVAHVWWAITFKSFGLLFFYYMIITSEVLREILEKLPDDFEVWYNNVPVTDLVEIDVSGKRIILKAQ